MLKEVCKLVVEREDDRLTIASLLVKNGYTVGEGKRQKTPTGKRLEYFLTVYKEGTNE